LRTVPIRSAQEVKVLAALDPDEREQFNGMLRLMMQVIDRPGPLGTPRSSESGHAAADGRSRFRPDAESDWTG
jgi:hypothetical protein